MEASGYIISILIGISLGLIGGGGSILAMPILVYLFKINPQLATSYSLFIVGVTAFIAAIKHYKLGNLKIKQAFLFAIPSVFVLLIVRNFLVPKIPNYLFSFNGLIVTKDILLMVIFGVLMIIAAFSMINNKRKAATKNENLSKLIIMGIVVGIVTGLLGAGGGFLIIPALIFGAGVQMKEAVGTSLVIIFINSTVGFLGDLSQNIKLDYKLLFTISSIAIIGMFIGIRISKKIKENQLKPIFGWFVLISGFFIIIKELT